MEAIGADVEDSPPEERGVYMLGLKRSAIQQVGVALIRDPRTASTCKNERGQVALEERQRNSHGSGGKGGVLRDFAAPYLGWCTGKVEGALPRADV